MILFSTTALRRSSAMRNAKVTIRLTSNGYVLTEHYEHEGEPDVYSETVIERCTSVEHKILERIRRAIRAMEYGKKLTMEATG